MSLQAWSSIVYQLIPNVQQLETNLRNFAQIIEADEVLLFERATFLVRATTSFWHGHVWADNLDLLMKVFFCLFLFCKCRWSPTISAKSSVMLTGLRRSVTLSNSSNSAVGEFTLQKHHLHSTHHTSQFTCWVVLWCLWFFILFLNSSKLAASFQSMEVRNSNFAAFIDVFTSNTYVMVIMSDPSIRKSWRWHFSAATVLLRNQISIIKIHVSISPASAATLINIRNARKHFEKLERVDGPKHSLHMRMR